jgi:hypothetical protein
MIFAIGANILYLLSPLPLRNSGRGSRTNGWSCRRSIGLRTRSHLDESDLAVLSQTKQATHKRLHSNMALRTVTCRLMKTIGRTTFALADPMDHCSVGAESLIRVLHLGIQQRSWTKALFRLRLNTAIKTGSRQSIGTWPICHKDTCPQSPKSESQPLPSTFSGSAGFRCTPPRRKKFSF